MPRYAGTVAIEKAKARRIARARWARTVMVANGMECQSCEFWNPLAKTPHHTALVRHGRCDLSQKITEQGDGCARWISDGLD